MEILVEWIQKLTGQEVPFVEYREKLSNAHPFDNSGIGYSQFNEILLTLGYNRVTLGFFRYIFGNEESIKNFRDFRTGVDSFRKIAMLKFGNFKYAFKALSTKSFEEIQGELSEFDPMNRERFNERHKPLLDIKKIPSKNTPYLGYLIQKELKDKLKRARTKKQISSLKKEIQVMNRVKLKGKHNHEVYLTYDHMDIYVATSMRTRFEFWNVSRFVDTLFSNSLLRALNIRWFDPTQAYCEDRIDKGLVEGLMLKRAKCTIYLAQESDTLGKDSELATTLAQEKPVIAYVPKLRRFDEFKSFTNKVLSEAYPGQNRRHLVMEFLRLYYPEGAWTDSDVRQWLDQPKSVQFDEVLKMIHEKSNEMYDKRANLLKEQHPLGLQVSLQSGVANGVLVVRSVPGCAKILRAILLKQLEFDIEETQDDPGATLLRERMTHSVFRVVTRDMHLTNSFWNFYT